LLTADARKARSAGWFLDGEHRSRCKTLGTLKDARSKISASWELMFLVLSFVLIKSLQRWDRASSTHNGPIVMTTSVVSLLTQLRTKTCCISSTHPQMLFTADPTRHHTPTALASGKCSHSKPTTTCFRIN